MTRTRRLSVAAACAVLAGLAWAWAPTAAVAQSSCRSACWESYGSCYKSTSNRQRCQAQLQRCLNGCMRRRR